MNSASNRFSVKKSGSPSHHSDKTNLIGDTHDDEVVVVSGGAGDQQQHYGAVFQNGNKKRKKGRSGKDLNHWDKYTTPFLVIVIIMTSRINAENE